MATQFSLGARKLAAVALVVALAAGACSGGSDDAAVTLPAATPPAATPAESATTSAPESETPDEPAPADRVPEDPVPAASLPAGLLYRGVNLAGAEFGDHTLPGEYDVEWTFPTYGEVDFFTDAGMNVFRVPFKWERLQPSLDGEFDQAHLALIDEFVRYASEQGASTLLDVHNYAYYYDQTLGTDAVPIDAFAAFWGELAERYAGNEYVMFGLMNEPIDIDSATWITAANAAIASIRDAGANNLILVPGVYWTGAHSWESSNNGTPNAEALLQVVDPANNFAVEAHQYLDRDHSGTSASCVTADAGSERLEDFTAWLYEHDLRGFLGEFGAGDGQTCLAALDGMLGHMEANDQVWLGWTYWAAGPWWGDYIFEIEPNGTVSDDPQFAVLADYLGQ